MIKQMRQIPQREDTARTGGVWRARKQLEGLLKPLLMLIGVVGFVACEKTDTESADVVTLTHPDEPLGGFVDNFDGPEIDSAKWDVVTTVELGAQTGRERAYINDGKLNLVFINDAAHHARTGNYLSGEIRSKRADFLYGRWDARLKPSNIPGVVNSMFVTDWRTTGASTGQEVDIEFLTYSFGQGRGEVWAVVHANGRQSLGTAIAVDFDPSADFHVWGFEITRTHIQWFVDNTSLYTYNYSEQPVTIDAPCSLRFNVWGRADDWVNGPSPPNVESIYQIDWVRFTPE